jgi:hypothetical protein
MRPGTASGKVYSPDQLLIQRYATTYVWKRENLIAVLAEFGPLPEEGQEQLIRCLVLAFAPYQLLAMTKERITPSQQHNRLKAIEKTAKKLLEQLGESAVNMWLSSAGIVTTGRDEAAINAELREASHRIDDIVRAVMDLHDRASTAARVVSKRIRPERGGFRHRPSAKGQLIRKAIAIYSHVRAQYPDSGKQAGFGGPMLRFVHAVAALYGGCVRESDIREVWRTRKSKQKLF